MRARSLAMGVRFAAGGGREGWVRTILTAIGVGLGVMLLLGAASVPHILDAREQRGEARTAVSGKQPIKRSDSTLLYGKAETSFRGQRITGALLRPDGPHAPAPPGVRELPRNGEMVVSPALAELLSSPEGKLLRERLHFTTVGTIAEPGLVGPGELAYYAVSDALTTEHGAYRIDGFGSRTERPTMNPVLLVLIIVACVVLLMPVAIFIATAVRFGGERRDRRLAALRLIGADTRTVRWTAAGEALFGAVCGLLVGTAMFLAVRQAAGSVTFWNVNAFPDDLTPAPALAVLVALAVPLCAVGVTFFALRAVAIEPLGVVRNSAGRRRRLWWRLPVPLVGIALLLANGPVGDSDGGQINPYLIAGGAVLMLFGITLLLPWVVEAAVGRFTGGPVPWQLATRRLQLGSGAAARAVSGITVAVAGAIALQLFFSAIQQDFMRVTGQDPHRAQLSVTLPSHDVATTRKMIDQLRRTEGVRGVIATIEAYVWRPGPLRKGEDFAPTTSLIVGDCPSLSELAHTGSCKDGDVFVVKDGNGLVDSDWIFETARPGARVQLNDADVHTGEHDRSPRLWTIPKSARIIDSRKDPSGDTAFGVFATPGALDTTALGDPTARAMVKTDPRVGDAAEYVRNTAARIDPLMSVRTLQNLERDKQYSSVRTGLLAAATATLALIAASMLVTTLEQLRERRRLLSVLVAFGTRRATLGWSVLWQTAVPVALGLALALAGGAGLGVVLVWMAGKSTFDWSVVWPLPAAGAALVLLVTLFSLPPLWRMMRPDGLRTE
ncbi:FtsX-like permease family protein [Streptomyces tubercidicus]|uniref:FtsX-like permease family protein n=1 Tax=Streptomyces tubercidicus TaxID=47759 RepID=UPI002E138986|nr:ABC transporter permease [Streptomyces tubercidicus]